MNLYLTADGHYVGTQAEAKRSGKGWTPEAVPTDKEGLIDYLNACCATAKAVAEAGLPVVCAEQETPHGFRQPVNMATAAVSTNPVARFKLEQGREVDQITDYIMGVEGWALGNIVSAVLERMAQLAKGIVR